MGCFHLRVKMHKHHKGNRFRDSLIFGAMSTIMMFVGALVVVGLQGLSSY
jgi:hypothetical protein